MKCIPKETRSGKLITVRHKDDTPAPIYEFTGHVKTKNKKRKSELNLFSWHSLKDPMIYCAGGFFYETALKRYLFFTRSSL